MQFAGIRPSKAGWLGAVGLIFHVSAITAAVGHAVIAAPTGITIAIAAVAAQPIEAKASAKVAMRDAVWRRSWLRRACTRKATARAWC